MRIKGEQNELAKERDQLQSLLASPRKLNNLIKKELQQDAEKYGDERRSPIVERSEAKAITEQELTPSEPVTIVLSEMGWVRSAKGHDIDPVGLSYKAGDSFKAAAKGKSNQPVVFIDSTGRSYAIEPNTLPSARGQGEPITGKLALPAGATIEHLLMSASENQKLLLASSAGYGFICQFSDLVTRNRNGKAIINLPNGAKVLTPIEILSEDSLLLSITQAGRMLIFPVKDLPELAKGKGNKIISLSGADDSLAYIRLITPETSLTLYVGKRKLTLNPADLEKFRAERARKGTALPRGLQKIDRIEVI